MLDSVLSCCTVDLKGQTTALPKSLFSSEISASDNLSFSWRNSPVAGS